mgnify:FL=1
MDMSSLSAAYYRKHYPQIQQAKYEQAWPFLKKHIPRKVESLLDIGIGYAWFEVLLKKKKMRLKRIMGVDVDELSIRPPRKNITYILDEDFETEETFDLVICWDAWHCFPKKNLLDWVKPTGLLLVSEPKPFVHVLEQLLTNKKLEILVDEWVGTMEKSRVVLARKI